MRRVSKRRNISLVLALLLTLVGAGGLVFLAVSGSDWPRGIIKMTGLIISIGVFWFYSEYVKDIRDGKH